MHVFLVPSFYPAAGNELNGIFFQEQALQLRKHGLKVGVLYPSYLAARGDEGEHEQDLSRYYPRRKFYRLHREVFVGWALGLIVAELHMRRYIARFGKPDILHAQCMVPGGMTACWLSWRYHIPYVLTEHSSGYYRTDFRARVRFFTFVKPVIMRAKRCMAVSRALCHRLEEVFAYSKGRWEVMPNMVDREQFKPPVEQANRVDHFTFLHVSLLRKIKRVDLILKAFAHAFAGDAKVHLVIGGDGPERSTLEAMCDELGIAAQVRFVGLLSREEVAQQMAAADALVVASTHETFSVVVIEALATGMPVISTRCGGPQDSIREGDGIFVPVGDVAAMAAAMRELRGNIGQYDGQAISQDCHARFSAPVVAQRHLDLYREICG